MSKSRDSFKYERSMQYNEVKAVYILTIKYVEIRVVEIRMFFEMRYVHVHEIIIAFL